MSRAITMALLLALTWRLRRQTVPGPRRSP
jgi:hypothetical protein